MPVRTVKDRAAPSGLGLPCIRPVNKRAEPDVSIYIGKYTGRVHVDVRLTAAEERGLYNALKKRFG